jgi:hypothetical protein
VSRIGIEKLNVKIKYLQGFKNLAGNKNAFLPQMP